MKVEIDTAVFGWDADTQRVFFTLLAHAAENGDVSASTMWLAQQTGFSRQKVRTIIGKLIGKIKALTNYQPTINQLGISRTYSIASGYVVFKSGHQPTINQLSTNLEREKENGSPDREKENFPLIPPYKEKEINSSQKEKERGERAQENFLATQWGQAVMMQYSLSQEQFAKAINAAVLYCLTNEIEATETNIKRYTLTELQIHASNYREKKTSQYEHTDKYGRYFVWGGDRYDIPDGASPRPAYNVRWDGKRWVKFSGN